MQKTNSGILKVSVYVNNQGRCFCFVVIKTVENVEEKKIIMPKKKVKELRILDGKTAQNLCM